MVRENVVWDPHRGTAPGLAGPGGPAAILTASSVPATGILKPAPRVKREVW